MYRVIPFESTRKEPRVAFWPTINRAALDPPEGGMTGAVVFVGAIMVGGTAVSVAGAIVAGAVVGVAAAQADTITARTSRAGKAILFFISHLSLAGWGSFLPVDMNTPNHKPIR